MPRDHEPLGHRLHRRERKRLSADRGPLVRRRAYRAAQQVLEEGFDLWKMADKKSRVAIMLLGPLNIILLALLSRPDVFDALPEDLRAPVVMGVVVYAGLAMVMFLLAIFTLRPEHVDPLVAAPPDRAAFDTPLGIRHYEDVVRRDLDDYQRAWREVRISQLVAEVAEQAHAVAIGNRRKFRALYRLFRGLQGMTALAVLLVLIAGLALFFAR